jgi:hypothetical protein
MKTTKLTSTQSYMVGGKQQIVDLVQELENLGARQERCPIHRHGSNPQPRKEQTND